MNFHRALLDRVITLVSRLLVQEDAVELGFGGTELITPNQEPTPYPSAIRKIQKGPLQLAHIDGSKDNPIVYVSHGGGRQDLATDTLISHIVEVVATQIDIILNTKAGVRDGDAVQDIDTQGDALVTDIRSLVNRSSLQSAIRSVGSDLVVHQVVLEEWEFDERWRGGQKEVLRMTFQTEIANPSM